jgi:hypothetical protein
MSDDMWLSQASYERGRLPQLYGECLGADGEGFDGQIRRQAMNSGEHSLGNRRYFRGVYFCFLNEN